MCLYMCLYVCVPLELFLEVGNLNQFSPKIIVLNNLKII